jgi:hypothetical protein
MKTDTITDVAGSLGKLWTITNVSRNDTVDWVVGHLVHYQAKWEQS